MNKDNIEGGVRKTAGQFEETVGRAIQDKQTTGQGLYDQAAGAAQNAYGQAKDMVSQAGDNLSQTASNAQDQVASFEANLRSELRTIRSSQSVSQSASDSCLARSPNTKRGAYLHRHPLHISLQRSPATGLSVKALGTPADRH